ncbi:MAG: DUF4476 domain-containing protein [Bacteroides sp.]
MKRILLPLLLLPLLLSSCASLIDGASSRKFLSIQQGMSQQEVLDLCKEPSYKRFDEGGEQWEYRGYYISGVYSVILMDFVNGVVAGLDMFPVPAANVSVSSPNPPAIVVEPSYRPDFQRPPHGGNAGYRDVMPEREFASFLHSLKSGFSTERLPKIREALPTNRFTSAQCRELVALFAFNDEKLELAKTVYPRVADKNNFTTVVETLNYFDREKMNEFIKGYHQRNH